MFVKYALSPTSGFWVCCAVKSRGSVLRTPPPAWTIGTHHRLLVSPSGFLLSSFPLPILIFNFSFFIFNLFFSPTPGPLPASGEGRRCSRPFAVWRNGCTANDAELDELIPYEVCTAAGDILPQRQAIFAVLISHHLPLTTHH